MFKKTALVAVLAACLAGCSGDREPEVARHEAAAPQPAPTQPAQPQFEPVAGIKFDVTPAEFRKCDASNGRIVAHVSWDASAAGAQFVNVLVGNEGAEPKLFTTGKASGERETGNWVVDGTQLILQNAANKQKLAVVTVKAKDC